MEPVTTLAAGAAAGGLFQIISEGFTLVSQFSAQQHKQLLASSEEGRKWLEAESAEAELAAKRGRTAGWLTASIALIVIISAFILSFVTGLIDATALDMPTSIVSEGEGFSLLWGLIDTGPELVVTEAKGWVQGPEFWPTVNAIAGFLFGIKGVKTVKRRL